jgi:hypothetical protein
LLHRPDQQYLLASSFHSSVDQWSLRMP